MNIDHAIEAAEQQRTQVARELEGARRNFSVALARRHLGLLTMREGDEAVKEARQSVSARASALADLDALLAGLKEPDITGEVARRDQAAEAAEQARRDALANEQRELVALLGEKKRLRIVEGTGLDEYRRQRLVNLLAKYGEPFDKSGVLLPGWPQP